MIRKMLSLIVVSASLIMIASLPVSAAGSKCAECGMMVMMESRFAAKIVQGDTTIPFCDIGDLFVFLNKKTAKNGKAMVRDHPTGAWIDAQKAFYVIAKNKFKTPMRWGIAAFKDKSEASKSGKAMDYDGMAKALK